MVHVPDAECPASSLLTAESGFAPRGSREDVPRVLAVLNSPDSGLGRFGTWLEELGAAVELREGSAIPATALGFDGVLLLGGGFMPDDDLRAPWLPIERALVRDALGGGTPVLGICLGAQILAQAAGGHVEASSGTPERGSVLVDILQDGAQDPLFAGMPSPFPAIENHVDRITGLPPGAVRLASTPECPVQAFRVRGSAWGVQFHPEAGADRLRNWDAARLAGLGVELGELERAAWEAEAESEAAARALLGNWVDEVRTAAAARPDFPVIDGHNDLPWRCRVRRGSSVEGLDGPVPGLHTDMARLRQGRVAGQFWAVYVDSADPHPVESTFQQIDLVHRLVARYPGHLRLARSAREAREATRAGRIASFLGVEGGHSIGDDLSVLRNFARLGVRYMTLTHVEDTSWADSATGARTHGGLTARGREIVAEMDRTGILVDLSHTSPGTMHDVLDIAGAPVLFSHSCAAALNDHPRNVPDDVIARLPQNGGVLMATFVPSFVSPAYALWARLPSAERGQPPAVAVSDVADHIDHIRQAAGVEHVGIGGDFDGTPVFPEDLRDVSRYPLLAQELRRRGWSARELRLLACENVLRVLDATDQAHPRT